jgi:hypothetical protein
LTQVSQSGFKAWFVKPAKGRDSEKCGIEAGSWELAVKVRFGNGKVIK